MRSIVSNSVCLCWILACSSAIRFCKSCADLISCVSFSLLYKVSIAFNPRCESFAPRNNKSRCLTKRSLSALALYPLDVSKSELRAACSKDWFAIVTCEIQGIFVDEKIMKDDSHIDTKKWKPLIYKFREYTSTGDRLGLNFNFQEV